MDTSTSPRECTLGRGRQFRSTHVGPLLSQGWEFHSQRLLCELGCWNLVIDNLWFFYQLVLVWLICMIYLKIYHALPKNKYCRFLFAKYLQWAAQRNKRIPYARLSKWNTQKDHFQLSFGKKKSFSQDLLIKRAYSCRCCYPQLCIMTTLLRWYNIENPSQLFIIIIDAAGKVAHMCGDRNQECRFLMSDNALDVITQPSSSQTANLYLSLRNVSLEHFEWLKHMQNCPVAKSEESHSSWSIAFLTGLCLRLFFLSAVLQEVCDKKLFKKKTPIRLQQVVEKQRKQKGNETLAARLSHFRPKKVYRRQFKLSGY